MAPKLWIERHGYMLAEVIADHDGWKDELATTLTLLQEASKPNTVKLYQVQKDWAQGLTTRIYTTDKRFCVKLFPERACWFAKER